MFLLHEFLVVKLDNFFINFEDLCVDFRFPTSVEFEVLTVTILVRILSRSPRHHHGMAVFTLTTLSAHIVGLRPALRVLAIIGLVCALEVRLRRNIDVSITDDALATEMTNIYIK